jgi:hypothetical protein
MGGKEEHAPEAVLPAVSLAGSDQLATVVRRLLAQNGGPRLNGRCLLLKRSSAASCAEAGTHKAISNGLAKNCLRVLIHPR